MTVPTEFHYELLEQAEHLIARDNSQASIRRGVSSAYYVLFHLLITEAVQRLGSHLDPQLQARTRRAFAHADMARVCDQFASGSFSKELRTLVAIPVEPALKTVAKTFKDLHDSRLTADYDLAADFDPIEAIVLHGITALAFRDWSKIKHTPNATTFLTALIFCRHWSR